MRQSLPPQSPFESDQLQIEKSIETEGIYLTKVKMHVTQAVTSSPTATYIQLRGDKQAPKHLPKENRLVMLLGDKRTKSEPTLTSKHPGGLKPTAAFRISTNTLRFRQRRILKI